MSDRTKTDKKNNYSWVFRLLKQETVVAVSAFCLMMSQPAQAVRLNKVFVTEGVDPKAVIFGGAQVQTWAGNNLQRDEIKLFNTKPNAIPRSYSHATPTLTNSGKINGGLPVSSTGRTAAQGWKPDPIDITDDHTASNHAFAKIEVDPLKAIAGPITYWDPVTKMNKQVRPINSVEVILESTAEAGIPTDRDQWHSADSFAGVELTAARIFNYTGTRNQPFVLLGSNQMFTGTACRAVRGNAECGEQKIQDPYFMTVTDLDTGETTTQEVMIQDAFTNAGSLSLDDLGLRLTIEKNNPNAFAKLNFSSDFPWVVDPYSYGVTLDTNGLTLVGDRFPLADWQITSTSDTIEAFFDFGVDGWTFDRIDVVPSQSLFTVGNTYVYDVGSGGGVFELATVVPEPSSLLGLLAFGTFGAASTLKRKLKPSKSVRS